MGSAVGGKSRSHNCETARPLFADSGDAHRDVMDMILGYWVSQAIRGIADFSLADHLVTPGLTAAQIAELEGASEDTVFRLLRAGVGLGLATVDNEGRFYATERMATLRKDAPRSLRLLALSFADTEVWRPWEKFLEDLRNGHSPTSAAVETDFYAGLLRNPEAGERFSGAMDSFTACWSYNLADVIDTSEVQRVVDIGGANGTVVRLLQQANPALQAVVFDQPAVVEWARANIARSGFPQRTVVVGGDYFESVPSGDLYVLKLVLHNWPDQECIEILQQCRRAALPGARFAIVEFIVGDTADPGRLATLDDLAMLQFFGGRARTLDEFDRLFAAAGLRRTEVRTTVHPQGVIEAIVETEVSR